MDGDGSVIQMGREKLIYIPLLIGSGEDRAKK